MVKLNKTSNLDFILKPFEKNSYFYTKLLTVDSFQREQEYFIYKHQLINRLIHGHGILYGLQVQEPITFDNTEKKIKIKLSAGAALDCFGQTILVPDSNKENEVKDTYQPGKPNYLYLEYNETPSGTASALVDETDCQNACTKDYIIETYKLSISVTPPTGLISGKVQAEDKPVLGAKIEALDTNKTVKAATFTNHLGKYSLFVPASTYTLRASAPNFESVEIPNVTLADSTQPIVDQDFSLTAAPSDSQTQFCEDLTQAYYTNYLRYPPECKEPKVFLAVLKGEEEIGVDLETTNQYRSVVHTNLMLHHLLCAHLADFSNPHRTTAAQVKALQSVNGVGNGNDENYVSNIDLESSKSEININPKQSEKKIDLNLEVNAVKRNNLNKDVIEDLLISDGSITIEPDDNNKRIQIRTHSGTGTDIRSVNRTSQPGSSNHLARADHVHDLADKVVTSSKIDDEAVTRETHLSDDITELITTNNRSLIALANIDEKTIDLSTNIAIGVVTFPEMTPGKANFSKPIVPFPLPEPMLMEKVAIAMAISSDKDPWVYMGDIASIPKAPLAIAIYQPEETAFRIFLKDRRTNENFESQSINWKVRWWAIPATQEIPEPTDDTDEITLEDFLKIRIAMQPGILFGELLSERDVNSETLRAALNSLIEQETITEIKASDRNPNNDQYFLQ